MPSCWEKDPSLCSPCYTSTVFSVTLNHKKLSPVSGLRWEMGVFVVPTVNWIQTMDGRVTFEKSWDKLAAKWYCTWSVAHAHEHPPSSRCCWLLWADPPLFRGMDHICGWMGSFNTGLPSLLSQGFPYMPHCFCTMLLSLSLPIKVGNSSYLS